MEKLVLISLFIAGSICLSCVGGSNRNGVAGDINANSVVVVENPAPTPPLEEKPSVPFNELAAKLHLPLPEKYPVSKGEMFSGTPASPILTEKRARYYRTVIGERSKSGPNFAGHYTVVTWGAGLGNFSIVVVDARTGKMFFPPFESVSRASYFEIDNNDPPGYRIDSKLFAFLGCPGKEYEGCSNWDKDGFYVYSFEHERFKLLKFVKRDEFEQAQKN